MAAKKKQSSKTDEQRSQASPEEWPLTADSNREILATAGIGASVSEVEVVLRHDPGMISLSITDNRKGFEVHENTSLPTRSEGIGLIGIHERLELLGGRLEIDFAPGEAHR